MEISTFVFPLPAFLVRDVFARLSWLSPVITIAAGFVAGLIAEAILRKLVRLATRTRFGSDDLVVRALNGMFLLWFMLAGLYFATTMVDVFPVWIARAQKALLVLFILSLTVVASRMASGVVALYSGKSEGLFPSTSIFRNLTAIIVFIFGILVILDTLGISVTPILTALGVGGLAVALALQDTLSNLFAGIQIIASRQVRIGDYIKLSSGEEGYVTDIRWRNTTVRALANNLILVPNAKLAQTIITNYHMPEQEMSVLVQVGVSYDSDLEKVERITSEVGKETMKEVKGGIPDFEPFIRYNKFADSTINFSVILRGKEFTDQYLITHEFIKRLQRRYQREGINIPFPIRTVYMKTEEKGLSATAR